MFFVYLAASKYHNLHDKSCYFSCFFRTLTQSPFWEAKTAKLPSKMGFRSQVWYPVGSNMWPLGAIFGPKSQLLSYPAKYFSLLWAPWGRPRRDLRPKTVQGHVFIDLRLTLAWVWTEFCQMLCRFWMLKAYLLCFFMDFQSPAGLYMQSLRTRPLCNNLRASSQLGHVANLAT